MVSLRFMLFQILRKMFFSHFMLFATFLEKKIWECFLRVFFYAGNIEKCPLTYSYWLNGNFNTRLEILKSAPSLTG